MYHSKSFEDNRFRKMKKCMKTDVNPFSAPWTRELFPNCALGALILLVLASCNHNYAVTFASDTQSIP